MTGQQRAGSSGRGGGLAVALDIGGTKVAAGLVDADGRFLHTMSIPTDPRGGQALLDAIVEIVLQEHARAKEVCGTGVSIAAAVDQDTGDVLWTPNIPNWDHVRLGRILEEATGLPVVVGFDGHLTTLGEHWIGAGKGTRNMVLLIIGTGVGGGLVLDGRLYRGSDDLAGCAGWMVSDRATLDAPYSTSKGNLESLASGPALSRRAQELLDVGQPSILTSPPLPEAIVAAANAGDAVASAVVRDAAFALGCAVTSIVSLLNPDVVVLGGGLGSTGAFLDSVRTMVSTYAQPMNRQRVRIVSAALGSNAGLAGAARALFVRLEGKWTPCELPVTR